MTLLLVGLGVFGLIFLLIERERRRVPSSPSDALTKRLTYLAERGFPLAKGHTIESFKREMGNDFVERDWGPTLAALGNESMEGPGGPFCEPLWYFDTECIEDHGDYARIVERMAEMAQGSLPLKDVYDYVDVEAGQASFGFTLHGEKHNVFCEVDNDWVDTKIFAVFVDLLAKTDPSKVYVYYDLRGQDCVLGCVTHKQLKQLRKSGHAFEPLS